MSEIVQGIGEAWRLLISGDPEVWSIAWLSLRVSLSATLIALLIGVPIGTVMALHEHPGKTAVVGAVHAGMALPPVVAGLVVSIFLWRSGPLGQWGLLYTPSAMVIAQAVIATPIVTGLTYAAVSGLDPRYRLQLTALGASGPAAAWALLREAHVALIAAVVAGFGAVISEVGAAMMVGGNIKGQTRVLTTATVLEVNRGHFATAIALSTILLILVYAVTLGLTIVQRRR